MTILLAQHFKVDARDIYHHWSCGEEPTEIELDPCFESYFFLLPRLRTKAKFMFNVLKNSINLCKNKPNKRTGAPLADKYAYDFSFL